MSRRWRRHAAAAEEDLCEQQGLAQTKAECAAAASADADTQAAKASEQDAAAKALSDAIAFAEDAALWASRGDAATLEIMSADAELQRLEKSLEQVQLVWFHAAQL